jgi:ParB family chromosome partitioning protein
MKPTNQSLFHPAANIDLTGIGESIINISPDKLKHYHNHPFKLYKGERLNDMVESIKANGILIPLLIRPVPEGGPNEYEVLAGHNRLESGKIAGLTEMPCIVKDGLTDEEAHLIVTESNLVQRSFSDLSHSERAEALSTHYNAIKHQGKRTDLIRQMEALLSSETADNPGNAQNPDNGANTPMGNKSIDVTGEKYGLSRNSVARYIRVNTLIAGLKELLDSEELSIRAGVSLSFMVDERQQAVLGQMQRYDVGVSMKQAEQLRLLNAEANKDEENSGEMFLLGCADILLGRNAYEKETKPTKAIRFKLDRSAMEPYFTEEDTEEDIQETILEALEFYHQYRNQVSSQQD